MSRKTLCQRVGPNLVLALTMLLILGVSAASGAPPAEGEMTYTVKLGDNLWTHWGKSRTLQATGSLSPELPTAY